MSVDKTRFDKVVTLVIDSLEGGYYHPDMLKDGRVKDSRYSNSGETMFGIDRKKGGTINDTPSGKAFWTAIDSANAKTKWNWNYMGGTLAPQLKENASGMIQPQYEAFSKRYLSAKTKQLVESDDRLLFNFIYATWNGQGWFRKFAKDMNKAIDSGITDLNKLTQVALDSRTKEGLEAGSKPNSLISQGGQKIAVVFEKMKEYTTATVQKAKENPIPTVMITVVLIIASYLLVSTLIKIKQTNGKK